MKWFQRKSVKDERIVNLKNQIAKEAWVLTLMICSISVIVKTFFFMGEQSVWVELVILIATGLYSMIRSVSSGVYSDEVEVHDQTHRFSVSKKQLMTGLASGLFLALFFGFRSAYLYADGDGALQVKYFLSVFAASLILYIPFFVILTAVSHLVMNKLSKRRSTSDLDDNDLNE
ncbi:hypothetical protein DMN77_03525 [Paenibacillus sp. 79R4]|uniref:DUF6773 family protein n=1 Tax=Paenibacillus sp. 79R4 TaxID=2212847 RepID=UPI0015C088C3|nr:DUF6773 family protein [Paenibacillus sp. 79R4]NWL86668.1 hypothetical protein [Paenibacillus sp. 79R4]